MQAGDLARRKGTRSVVRIVVFGRNKCKVEMVPDPEFYADLDDLVAEERWVPTSELVPYVPKKGRRI